MATFGKQSHGKLVTCHRDIQTVMIEAIKYFDFSVIEGHRPIEKQFEYWQKGRELRPGADPKERNSWDVIDKSKIITHIDGYEKKGNHNYDPSKAIDIEPWPINYKNIPAKHALAGLILYISEYFYKAERIENKLRWGGHWKSFKDLPHFEI